MSPKLPANAIAAVLKAAAGLYDLQFVNATTACGPDLTGCIDGCAPRSSHWCLTCIGQTCVCASTHAPVL